MSHLPMWISIDSIEFDSRVLSSPPTPHLHLLPHQLLHPPPPAHPPSNHLHPPPTYHPSSPPHQPIHSPTHPFHEHPPHSNTRPFTTKGTAGGVCESPDGVGCWAGFWGKERRFGGSGGVERYKDSHLSTPPPNPFTNTPHTHSNTRPGG